MDLTRLHALDPRAYEHPFDQKALDALQRTKGLDVLVKKFYEYGIERLFQIQCIGSNLKVTPSSFPTLYDLVEDTCQVLHLMHTPEVYIRRSDELTGLTTGVDTPIVILSTACIDGMTDEELRFVIGREIGHIKSRHVLYYEIGTLLPVLTELLAAPTMGIGALLTVGLQLALLRWQRMSEYTADRAGLLACQDVAVATTALAKIAGLPEQYYDAFNLDDFVNQAREFEGFDETKYDRALKYLSLLFGQQQWSVVRASELYRWIDDGSYKRVLEGETSAAAPEPAATNFCPHCGHALTRPVKFCPQCGTRLA